MKNVKIYDITMMIHADMMIYKNDPTNKPRLSFVQKMPADSINQSSICLSLHTGTHIDAPFHMIDQGATMEATDLDQLITPCRVIDFTNVQDGIGKKELQKQEIASGEFLLFKTKNSFSESFDSKFVYLNKDGAAFLAEKNIIGVGIDGLGIERDQPNHDTHKTLMKKHIVIIEGLRLKEVPPGYYSLIALPLNIKGVDGAPARVVLLREEEEEKR